MNTTTVDHNEIRKWAEDRGAQPTQGGGAIRLDFPGWSGERSLEPITWEEFFETFEKSRLAFLYQEETADGERSNFNKFVKRAPVQGRTSRSPASPRSKKARIAPRKSAAARRAARRGTSKRRVSRRPSRRSAR